MVFFPEIKGKKKKVFEDADVEVGRETVLKKAIYHDHQKKREKRKKKDLNLNEKESLDVSWSSVSEPELVNRRHMEAEVSCLQVRAVAARRPRGQTVKAAEEANQQRTHCNCIC